MSTREGELGAESTQPAVAEAEAEAEAVSESHRPISSFQNRSKRKRDEHEGKIFNRIWIPEDEIKLLEEMLNYKKLQLPSHDDDDNNNSINWQEFYCMTKEQLNLEATKQQVIDKVRKLKRKLRKISSKRRRTRSKPTRSMPESESDKHREALLDLYERIWGSRSGEIITANGECKNDQVAAVHDLQDDNNKNNGNNHDGVARAATGCRRGPFTELFRKEVELNLKVLKVSIGQAQLALSLYTKFRNKPLSDHNV